MDIVQAHLYFDLVIDKVGSPYFTSNEKDLFIQRGQIDFVNQFFDKRLNKYSAEQNSFDTERIYPLMEQVIVLSDVDGKVYYDDINSNLSSGSLMYILSFNQQLPSSDNCTSSLSDFVFSQFVRHNDLGPRLQLSLKKPTDNKPIHAYYNDYIRVFPSKEKSVSITVVKTPAVVTIDDNNDTGVPGNFKVDFDLPESTRNEILMFALKNAGINIRDKEFFELINNQQDKNT